MTQEAQVPMVPETEAPVVSAAPREVVSAASQEANVLRDVIERQELYTAIGGKNHVLVEGWQTLAALKGCLASEVPEAHERLEDGTHIAVCRLVRIADGKELARASASCSPEESRWQGRDDYAVRSMAITRATGKVCRNAFAWVMALAGYETTPAEEMDGVESRGSAASSAHEPRGRKRNEGRAPATISEPQRKRLWAITMEKAESLGMSKDEATNALRDVIQKFGVEQTTEIERKDYEAVVASVEKWG